MNSTTALERMPDAELVEEPLDTTRSELQGLMDRYRTKSPGAQRSIVGPPTAVIVTRHPGEEAALRQPFADEGWAVKTCAGPGTGDCPLMHGGRCGLRKSADAAVVYVDANEFSGSLGTVPRLRCAADSSSPGVVVVKGSRESARFLGRSATIGTLRGAGEIVDTVTALVRARCGEDS